MNRRATQLAAGPVALLLAGCAADVPGSSTDFDESAGVVRVKVLGDGFVETAGERVPLESVILTLRQRARAMSRDERARFVVQLDAAPFAATADAKKRTAADLDRMLRELQIMGIQQVRYL